MKLRAFAQTGVSLPIIGQGTWNMERDDRVEAIRALRRGIDAGMTHIDTAELYGSGRVEEEIVAEAIEGRRDDVYLVSKVLPQNASRRGTIAACERSLSRLRTDRLDLYLLHWLDGEPLEGTFGAFETLTKEGKIRAYGVSNFDVEELRAAVKIAGRRIACNQVLYHLQERAIEHQVLPYCEEQGIAVVGYSPFGSGRFPPESSAGGRALQTIANAHGATPRQVALAFLVRRPSLFAIPKASETAHALENAGAGDLELTAPEIERIDAAFPRGRRRSGVPTL